MAMHDPYASREALRYKTPIASRETILEVLHQHQGPLSKLELVKLLGIKKTAQKEALEKRLSAMEKDGQLVRNRQGNYGPVSKMNMLRGRVIGHREGYGFVVPDDGSSDLYLSAQYMRAVFDGDTVLVRPTHTDRKGRRECALVQVLECNTQQIVGRLKKNSIQQYFVIPENKKITHMIFVENVKETQAKEDQIVIVQITSQPTYQQQPAGKIINILGEERAPGMEIDIAIHSHSIPENFPKEVMLALKNKKLFKELTPGKTYPDRIDIRHLPLVTIDGEDAMDFDDAVFCEKKRQGYRLIVAIADVSFYVKPDSALDQEAYRRGNSVYFPGRVIPMLPEVLSNGLCSLKPHLDRFCMVCDINLNEKAEVTRYKFYPGIMHSHARLTYTQVHHALNNQKNARESLGGIYPHIEVFHELYLKLLDNRQKRGALDFNTTETKVIFDENKKIKNIVPVVRNDAHKMIEEAMLLANVCAAQTLAKHKSLLLYRIHEGPAEEKLKDLRYFLKEFGLGLQGASKPAPKDYADLLKTVSKRKDAGLIHTVLLRSLKQAVYSPENIGHFGLAYDAYTHFTSPIRRYPDLCVHRELRNTLAQHKTLPAKIKADLEKKLHLTGEHCSFTERRADEAVRDALSALKCEYMTSHTGETFQGLITGVTGFGLFVELKDIYIDGLIHITTLPGGYYHFDAAKHRLTDEHTGLKFSLGDTVKVTVVRVDVDNKRIDLELVQEKRYVKNKKKSK